MVAEQMAITRQVIKDAAKETARIVEAQLSTLAHRELSIYKVNRQREKSKVGLGEEVACDLENATLRAEKTSLRDKTDTLAKEVQGLRDQLWGARQENKVLKEKIESAEQNGIMEQNQSADYLERILAVKQIVSEFAGVLHMHPELLMRLKAKVIDVPSMPNTQNSQPSNGLEDDDPDFNDALALMQMEEGDD